MRPHTRSSSLCKNWYNPELGLFDSALDLTLSRSDSGATPRHQCRAEQCPVSALSSLWFLSFSWPIRLFTRKFSCTLPLSLLRVFQYPNVTSTREPGKRLQNSRCWRNGFVRNVNMAECLKNPGFHLSPEKRGRSQLINLHRQVKNESFLWIWTWQNINFNFNPAICISSPGDFFS